MKKLLLFAMFAMFAMAAGNAVAQTVQESAVSGKTVREPLYPGTFALRTNLLYDALLTPTLGVEWRLNASWGLKLDGSYGYFGGNFGKRHNVWLVSPEVRYYLGNAKRFYLGLGANVGGYDIYEFGPVAALFPDDRGYEGMLYNGGLVAGYQLKLSRSFSLDFNLGVGYTRLEYDAFTMARCESCSYKEYKEQNVTKNWFGPTQAGISLVWHFGRSQRKTGPAYAPSVPAPAPERVIEKVVRDTVVKIVRDTVIREVIRKVPQEISQVMTDISTLFSFDSYGLSGEAKTKLGRVVSWLKDHPSVRAIIEGHTDNIGSAAYNQRLSENRAKSVYDYFVSEGVAAERLSYKGYGPDHPAADNNSEDGRAKNRCVTLKITE